MFLADGVFHVLCLGFLNTQLVGYFLIIWVILRRTFDIAVVRRRTFKHQ